MRYVEGSESTCVGWVDGQQDDLYSNPISVSRHCDGHAEPCATWSAIGPRGLWAVRPGSYRMRLCISEWSGLLHSLVTLTSGSNARLKRATETQVFFGQTRCCQQLELKVSLNLKQVFISTKRVF